MATARGRSPAGTTSAASAPTTRRRKARSYLARVTRDGDWWKIAVPDIDGAGTQTRRFADIDGQARDHIAEILDVPKSQVQVDPQLQIGRLDVTQAVADRDEYARLAHEYTAKATAENRRIAQALASQGVSYREIAAILDISHQYVGSLLK